MSLYAVYVRHQENVFSSLSFYLTRHVYECDSGTCCKQKHHKQQQQQQQRRFNRADDVIISWGCGDDVYPRDDATPRWITRTTSTPSEWLEFHHFLSASSSLLSSASAAATSASSSTVPASELLSSAVGCRAASPLAHLEGRRRRPLPPSRGRVGLRKSSAEKNVHKREISRRMLHKFGIPELPVNTTSPPVF